MQSQRDRPLEVDERTCMICWKGEIEDETHFVLDCDVYEDLRERMFHAYSHALARQQKVQVTQIKLDIQQARKEEEGRRKLMAGLFGEATPADERLRRTVFVFCKRAMRRRNNLVRSVLDQMT